VVDAEAEQRRARALARLSSIFHNLTYFCPEMREFAADGLPQYWRAYVAYRSAPLGPVPAPVVTAAFYNFAPRVIEAAIPSAWEVMTPQQALARRDELIDRALRRLLGPAVGDAAMARAAGLARVGIETVGLAGRPLFAAHQGLAWPDEPHRQLFWATTLWREHRGDGHNVALAAAGIGGLECHVLLGGKGVVSAGVIEKIRGWTAEQWAAAQAQLIERGLLDADGRFTDAGRVLHADIETHTDALSAEPRRVLGPDRCDQLIEALEPYVAHLVDSGAVAPSWPPKRLPPAGGPPGRS
jgi:hypothetical protein